MPAANFWLGLTTNFDDPNNWSAGRAPIASDDLYFDGSVDLDDTDCIFSTSRGTLFSSIHLLNEYDGTVTIPFDITFGGFVMESGAINQSNTPSMGTQTAAYTISVNAAHATLGNFGVAFSWTGGVLNSGTNAGVVSIVGMTNATIGNGTDTAYSHGSDLKLFSGTILSASGSIVLNNGAGLEVNEFCQVKGPQPQPTIPPPVQPKTWVELLKGVTQVEGSVGHPIKGLGMVLLKGEASGLGGACRMPILIDGGTLNVVIADLNVSEVFEQNPGGQPWDPNDAPAVLLRNVSGIQGEPKLNIRDGRQFTVTGGGVFVRDGMLTTQVEATKIDGTPAGLDEHVAKIHGRLVVYGGKVMIGANDQGTTHTIGTLHVSGDIIFSGGTYSPHVFADNDSYRDRWTTDRKFLFQPAAKIDPIIHGTEGAGRSWEVIRGVKGFGDAGRPTTTLAADWELEPNELPPQAPADSPRWIRVRKK